MQPNSDIAVALERGGELRAHVFDGESLEGVLVPVTTRAKRALRATLRSNVQGCWGVVVWCLVSWENLRLPVDRKVRSR